VPFLAVFENQTAKNFEKKPKIWVKFRKNPKNHLFLRFQKMRFFKIGAPDAQKSVFSFFHFGKNSKNRLVVFIFFF